MPEHKEEVVNKGKLCDSKMASNDKKYTEPHEFTWKKVLKHSKTCSNISIYGRHGRLHT